jgi:hypothetical protein
MLGAIMIAGGLTLVTRRRAGGKTSSPSMT